MIKSLLLLQLTISLTCFSQSKKEQIDYLTQQKDSLTNVLTNERLINNLNIQELDSIIYVKNKIISENQLEIKELTNDLENKTDKISLLEKKIKNCYDSIEILSNSFENMKQSSYKLFLFHNIMEVDSWVHSASVIGLLNGKEIEYYDIAIDNSIEEIKKNEYGLYNIPFDATSAFYLGYTSGDGILFSKIENGYINIYYGGREETDMELNNPFKIKLIKKIKMK